MPVILIQSEPPPIVAPPAPHARVNWSAKPSAQNVMDAYPEPALKAGMDGAAKIKCEVKPDGALEHCAVTEEAPTEMGFGPAALRLSPYFHMQAPVAPGATVTVPIIWKLARETYQPTWVAKPTGEQFANVYPERAQREGRAGGADLECLTTADGRVDRCKVIAEAPAGYGFGQASLQLAKFFRMKPPPAAGAVVRIPLRFASAS